MDEAKKDVQLTLTFSDLDQYECFRDLLPDQKQELIALIYEIALALYKIYEEQNE